MRINGLPVVDATKKVQLHITPRDIQLGDVKDPTRCAAARACKRQMGATNAQVRIAVTYVQMGNKFVRYTTPGSLRAEIIAFDRGGSFVPGSYTLMPVRPSQKLGHGRGAPKR